MRQAQRNNNKTGENEGEKSCSCSLSTWCVALFFLSTTAQALHAIHSVETPQLKQSADCVALTTVMVNDQIVSTNF